MDGFRSSYIRGTVCVGCFGGLTRVQIDLYRGVAVSIWAKKNTKFGSSRPGKTKTFLGVQDLRSVVVRRNAEKRPIG